MTGIDDCPDEATFFAGGTWRPVTSDAGWIELSSAADGTSMGRVRRCGTAEVGQAVDAAAKAAAEWRRSRPSARAGLLRALGRELESDTERLARIISLEVGTPLKISRRLQVGLPVAVLEQFALAAEEIRWRETIGNSTVVREGVGVVGAITPWNYPVHQVVAKLGAAVAAGCALVVKPSEVAVHSVRLLAEATERAGFPPGLFNVVTGDAEAGAALVDHPGVELVSFTGSTAVGAEVAARAASRVAKVTLELGGKSASVVFGDADVPRAVRTTVGNAFLNSGQTCTAWSRLLVPRHLQDEVVELAREAAGALPVGHPLEETTRLGPLATPAQAARTKRYVDAGRRHARLVFEADLPDGLPAGGSYVPSTVFADVDHASELAQEEIFGPVLSIIPFDSEAEAVQMANATPYGLAAAVWSADEERLERVAGELSAGQVDLNGGRFNPAAPFGGYRRSGTGRELGRYGVLEFTQLKSMQR